uniref:Cytochrome P450 CYP4TT1 n=1 Tax=Epicauta chinensis TaxID=941254 RepID=A0A8K1XY71_9CUCU|nr:cytochrome P450 CYP4TT1 [Epicauta chinensis]
MDVAILIYSIFSIIGISLIWWYYKIFKFRKLNGIPGPKPWPLIGNAIELGSNPCEALEGLINLKKSFGNIYKIFVGSSVKIVLSDPTIIGKIVQSNIHLTKSDAYDLLKPWIGTGLLTSTGSKWKSRRKLITPSFHFRIIEKFIPIFDKNANTLVEKLKKVAGKPSTNVQSIINLCSLDNICETSLGQEINALNNENSTYVNAVRNYLDIFVIRWFSSWQRSPLLYKLSKDYKRFSESLMVVKDFSTRIIKEREGAIQYNDKNQVEEDFGKKERLALLDMLLVQKDKDSLTVEDIREEIDTFTAEGHDTITAGLTFAIYALATNPEVQNKLYDEIRRQLQDDSDPITSQKLNELEYLDKVLKESLRFYPPVPFIERQLEQDFTIGDQTYPAGTAFNMFIYGMHHSEEFFPNPEKFDPERFSYENTRKRHKFAYLPFSAGPRNCIGQRYAIIDIKLLLVKILQNFELLPVPGFKPQLAASATLQAYNGMYVQFKSRST